MQGSGAEAHDARQPVRRGLCLADAGQGIATSRQHDDLASFESVVDVEPSTGRDQVGAGRDTT